MQSLIPVLVALPLLGAAVLLLGGRRLAAFVSPEIFRYHYDRVSAGYVAALREAAEHGEVGPIEPEVAAWALMAIGEMIGLRWILWGGGEVPDHVAAELARIIRSVLEPPA